MDPDYLMLILYIFLIYWFIVFVLDKKGILERYNISAFGPILMIRTTRGQKLLERLSKGELKERFWRTYANVGTILVLIAMIYMFVLVLRGAYVMFMVQPEPTILNEPRNILLIPGLNEFIPLCAWIGFVITLVVHEFSHAILSTVEKIKVKSMGLLVALIPIGAFAEPDSEQLFGKKENGKKTREETELEPEHDKELKAGKEEKIKKVATARERTRILSAGVTSNFFVALIAFALFFSLLFAIQPVSEGVGIARVVEGSPAAKAGIEEGMSIIMMDNEPIEGYKDFLAFMNRTTPRQEVEVDTKDEKFSVRLEKHPHEDKGFLGVSVFPTKEYLEVLQEIPSSLVAPSSRDDWGAENHPAIREIKQMSGWQRLMIMPFLPLYFGFGGFDLLPSYLYEPMGVASFLGGSIFVIADVLFWIGWINLWVGLFNCLPAIPLDGGYVFREMLNPVLRMGGIKDEKKKEKISKAITAIISIFIASSIAFMLVGPYFW
uniref:Peptidase M50 domain-containing protein n=1 Tax=Candidatus Methanophagaceae archaeon ANME-1 ERB6 TaxID=2759912 RepID=A0A7G9YWM0_9EURY|nr:hypothetical protein IAKEDICC_00025 [Methanosarcinales archaeon ANME-1 ERB6]